MCTKTGIKDAYRGVQGACPRRAVTHAGGMAKRSERRAVGMSLKLVGFAAMKTKVNSVFSDVIASMIRSLISSEGHTGRVRQRGET